MCELELAVLYEHATNLHVVSTHGTHLHVMLSAHGTHLHVVFYVQQHT